MMTAPFQSDNTRALMASGLFVLGPAGRCNQCEVRLDVSFRFRWCDHILCFTCARGVLGACPQCHAEPPMIIDDDYDVGERIEEPLPPLPSLADLWRRVLAWIRR